MRNRKYRFHKLMLSADSLRLDNSEEVDPFFSRSSFRRTFWPDVIYDSKELEEKINQSIGIIKKNGDSEHVVPLELRRDGKHYKEIAEEMGIPLGTVKSHIYRGGILVARKTLELIGECEENPGIIILKKIAGKPIGKERVSS